jgi:haloacetate dehalogenase
VSGTGNQAAASPKPSEPRLFDGFDFVEARGVRLRMGGHGPPVLLLHGHPQTHAMWHAVAPILAPDYTVVAADLPGYGRSAPVSTGSKRDMATLLVEMMSELGFDRFLLAGHDRGGRCAYRLALDRPERVEGLAVLDIVPTADMWRKADKEFGLVDWHWFFLAQPEPFPEKLIAASPDAYYLRGDRSRFHPEALADYLAAVRDPAVIHAMCQDYRAGATIDHELDEADLAQGRRIECPVLALWAGRDELGGWFDVVRTWRRWAADVRGRAIDAGHFLAEERPEEVAAELRAFFDEVRQPEPRGFA